jgi:deoxycytidylate deaminase
MSDKNAPPDLIVALAVDTANRSPCAKSKRGVVIYEAGATVGAIYGNAFNGQPWPYECDGSDACKAACSRLCVHAEQRAIMAMLRPSEIELAMRRYISPPPELQLVHAKTVDGKLVPSREPSCDQCSKLILEARISRVWLYEGDGYWSSYDAGSFHRHTLKNNKLPVII